MHWAPVPQAAFGPTARHSLMSKQATIDELKRAAESALLADWMVPNMLAGSAGLRSNPGAQEQRYPPGMLVHWAPTPHGLFLHSSMSVWSGDKRGQLGSHARKVEGLSGGGSGEFRSC